MPRPSLESDHLSIAQLEGILASRRMKLSKLERKRDGLQNQLDTMNAKIASLGGNSRLGRPRKFGPISEVGHVSRLGRPAGRIQNVKSLSEAIHDVLSSGGAMKVGDIVKSVLALGYKTTSDNFRAIVNQGLIKDKRFASAGYGLYQLKKSEK